MSTTTTDTPEWLAKRGGQLCPGVLKHTWLVMLGGSMQYKLAIVPVKGQHGCAITQTNNGKRLDKGTAYPTEDAALAGGLDELRQGLGW
jgi:hypothetical protein